MLSEFFRGFQKYPIANNTIPIMGTPMRGAEKPLNISKMAPITMRMHPISRSLNFILSMFFTLSSYSGSLLQVD